MSIKDLVHGYLEPIQKSLVGPASPDSFDAVVYLAEGGFDGIGIERNPLFVLKPPVEEGGDVAP